MTIDTRSTAVREGEPPVFPRSGAASEGAPIALPAWRVNVRWLLLAVLINVWGVICWLLIGPPLPDLLRLPAEENERANQRVDQTLEKKYQRIKEGMSLEEVKAIMGPAGLSYSSQSDREYYIWKSAKGWIRIWVEQDKVTAKQFDPQLTSVRP